MKNAVPDIIAEMAARHDLPVEQVARAVKSQFGYTAHVMRNSPGHDTIRLRYLGSFSLNAKRKKYLDERSKTPETLPE
jgi:nucleoid DNA-binding protein